MAKLPNPDPKPYLGIEIRCTWPSAAFITGAIRDWDQEVYEAWPQPSQRVAAGSLEEIKRLIREALQRSDDPSAAARANG
jgi:hypothetical protein